MQLYAVTEDEKKDWDVFVSKNFPIVGGFFQSWKWGEFQSALGNPIFRYAFTDNDEWIGVVLLEQKTLPLGITYVYAPRGPVFLKSAWRKPTKINAALYLLEKEIKHHVPRCGFIRMEPAIPEITTELTTKKFKKPHYYNQPRHNAVVSLIAPEEKILQTFARGLQQSMRKAERRGVSTTFLIQPSREEYEHMQVMRKDTRKRAHVEIFPSETYFEKLFQIFPAITQNKNAKNSPSLATFLAYQEGKPIALNIAMCFADTMTYLFGATYTDKLTTRAAPYLHWTAMRTAKEWGFKHYDLGAVDESRWPSITYFKKQFGTETVSYTGLLDMIVNQKSYTMYNMARKITGK